MKSYTCGVSNQIDSSTIEPCAKYRKLHRGECLVDSKVCYLCQQLGHQMRNCPNSTQRSVLSTGSGKDSTQKSLQERSTIRGGKHKVIESSVVP